MMRRLGDLPEHGRKYHMRPGAYAILPLKHRVLLTAQIDRSLSGGMDIQLPGGGIDPGESPLQALHREVREEIGWAIAKPRRLGAFRRFVFMPEYDMWAEKICTVYWSRPTLRMGPPLEDGHHAVWVPMHEAPALLSNDGDAAFVASLL